ncbi:P2 phage tail completion R family protein [Desulfovibrio sp. X2]|uniref:phage tail protein n=1 Tax=Desulfovibrio sp. X2 TaxID=941449 RepID=UPI000358D0FF|nr:phage tail protein [Desulfovibrio sp. X2]EPR43132.1 P2 phage tail completion R family protein [Desulfovibrio sp. X2]
MRKIAALVAHLEAATGIKREQIHAYADKGNLSPSGRHLGFGGPDGTIEQIEIGVWKYDAVIQIERYAGDGPALLAIILGWLEDNDADREGLLDPEVDVELNDNLTCDFELACEFEEFISVVADEAGPGPIAFNGKRWRVAEPDITAADSLAGMEGHRG